MNNFDTNMENYKKMRYSRQREEIYEYLCHTMEHPSAEKIYQDLRIKMPNISLGTVYRNLNLLADIGEIQKLSTGLGPDRFDGNPAPHYHFSCRCCGCVLDLPLSGIDHSAPGTVWTSGGGVRGGPWATDRKSSDRSRQLRSRQIPPGVLLRPFAGNEDSAEE